MRSDILYDSVGDTYIRHVIMLNMAKRSGIQSSFCSFLWYLAIRRDQKYFSTKTALRK